MLYHPLPAVSSLGALLLSSNCATKQVGRTHRGGVRRGGWGVRGRVRVGSGVEIGCGGRRKDWEGCNYVFHSSSPPPLHLDPSVQGQRAKYNSFRRQKRKGGKRPPTVPRHRPRHRALHRNRMRYRNPRYRRCRGESPQEMPSSATQWERSVTCAE